MRECLLTIAILHVVSLFVITNTIPERSNLVSCLHNILLKHFSQEIPVLVSFLDTATGILEDSPNADDFQPVDFLLRYTNMEHLWLIYVYRLCRETHERSAVILPYKPQGYVIFVGP
ncbi:hypothetical protein L798_12874 [Zootermopsis nevadensis]|uniref:Uncharacterized protein n=1 Tax=Zootermopsis nevadensis TaxID=136037 RepID=A0A067R205_ZOONE|nr:hypothetical protein L798_12874 [Zootermopsis nevadensis]